MPQAKKEVSRCIEPGCQASLLNPRAKRCPTHQDEHRVEMAKTTPSYKRARARSKLNVEGKTLKRALGATSGPEPGDDDFVGFLQSRGVVR